MTIYDTGMRISEALAVAVAPQDIDHSTGAIRIRALKKRQQRDFRRIPVSESLLPGLLQMASAKGEGRL